MTKNVMKVMVLVMVACMLMFAVATCVDAADKAVTFAEVDTGTVVDGASDSSGAASSIQRIIGAILTIVQIVGMGVAVIMLIVLAIKYISAAPGDKADIKKHAVVYVVGAVVLFAAGGILQIVKKFALNISADA